MTYVLLVLLRDNELFSSVLINIDTQKIARRKYVPDCMAAGSRLPRSSHGDFSPFH